MMRIYVILIVVGFLLIPPGVQANAAKIYKDVAYFPGGNEKQVLDIYMPEDNIGERPVHIYVHGGAWMIGDKSYAASRGSKFYTDRGIIFVSINYRLAPDFRHPAQIQDVNAAVKWVFEHIKKYGGNPDNAVLSGHSAGAHLVGLAGTHQGHAKAVGLDTSRLKAIIPVDTASFDLTQETRGKGERLVRMAKKKTFGESYDVLADASPTLQVPPQEVRLSPYVIFVTADRPNAVEETQIFAKALQTSGHQATSYVLDDKLSHADMNQAIFKDSVISAKVLDLLGVR